MHWRRHYAMFWASNPLKRTKIYHVFHQKFLKVLPKVVEKYQKARKTPQNAFRRSTVHLGNHTIALHEKVARMVTYQSQIRKSGQSLSIFSLKSAICGQRFGKI